MTSLRERREAIRRGGGADKLAARREKGLLNARERIGALCQDHTFQEGGAHVRHAAHAFDTDGRELPADAVIVGSGYVDGRPVAVVSQDFTVAAGTLGKAHAQKFDASCSIEAGARTTQGSGTSRRSAEQAAALAMLELLDEEHKGK